VATDALGVIRIHVAAGGALIFIDPEDRILGTEDDAIIALTRTGPMLVAVLAVLVVSVFGLDEGYGIATVG
jgi:hypothetical protein